MWLLFKAALMWYLRLDGECHLRRILLEGVRRTCGMARKLARNWWWVDELQI